ncbi:MAG: hypothetical protein N4A33_05115 [Bacteriovoracaceae bacterium]|jgi:hypothetical protein|nr:hypothetical protein [Bacteriovoracaceae bacterium]
MLVRAILYFIVFIIINKLIRNLLKKNTISSGVKKDYNDAVDASFTKKDE